jgi:transposase
MCYSNEQPVGLDVHTESIAVAHAGEAQDAAVVSWGRIGTRRSDIDKLIRTLTSQAIQLVFAHETCPCGYWPYRYLRRRKLRCWVVAPALVPK